MQQRSALSQWSQSTLARNLADLQQCATLGELVAGGQATETSLSNSLANSTLRISMLMTFGQSLFKSGDHHHSEMFFEAIVLHHASRATIKQLGRSYLWVGAIEEDQGLTWKYQQQSLVQAGTNFEIAIANFLAAKNVSATNDWVRDVGWLGAAACYRELAERVLRRQCLVQLLAETNPVPMHRDMANYQLASTYVEEHRWEEAIQVYRQMHAQLSAVLATGQQQYRGQTNYLTLINSGLDLCASRLATQNQAAP
jgi:pentatricopeptide repeat protein